SMKRALEDCLILPKDKQKLMDGVGMASLNEEKKRISSSSHLDSMMESIPQKTRLSCWDTQRSAYKLKKHLTNKQHTHHL
ncbi:hypothetical protein INT45_010413, partial [Circinella minor]